MFKQLDLLTHSPTHFAGAKFRMTKKLFMLMLLG